MKMTKRNYIDENYDYFIDTDLSQYEGKYIAIHDNKIQFSGSDLKRIYYLMKEKYPNAIPFITKVCSGQAMIL